MRRFSFVIALTLPLATVGAQSPPTKVDKARGADPQTGELPPTASWRGTDIESRGYAETRATEGALEKPDPPAGASAPASPPPAFQTDGDAYPTPVEEPVEFAGPNDAALATTEEGLAERQSLDRYTYDENGAVVRVDRYRRGEVEPFRSFDYEYTTSRTVVEREVMPDGSRRFVREVGLDAFQASQGPGNQPYRDNRNATQAYPVENAARPTPRYPQLGTDADVSPE